MRLARRLRQQARRGAPGREIQSFFVSSGFPCGAFVRRGQLIYRRCRPSEMNPTTRAAHPMHVRAIPPATSRPLTISQTPSARAMKPAHTDLAYSHFETSPESIARCRGRHRGRRQAASRSWARSSFPSIPPECLIEALLEMRSPSRCRTGPGIANKHLA